MKWFVKDLATTARQWQVWGLRRKVVAKFMSYVLQTPCLQKLCKLVNCLTLSRLGPRLDHILSLAIHISPNNGVINTVQSGKLVVNVLAMHCALSIIIFGLILVAIWYHYIVLSGWLASDIVR